MLACFCLIRHQKCYHVNQTKKIIYKRGGNFIKIML